VVVEEASPVVVAVVSVSLEVTVVSVRGARDDSVALVVNVLSAVTEDVLSLPIAEEMSVPLEVAVVSVEAAWED